MSKNALYKMLKIQRLDEGEMAHFESPHLINTVFKGDYFYFWHLSVNDTLMTVLDTVSHIKLKCKNCCFI